MMVGTLRHLLKGKSAFCKEQPFLDMLYYKQQFWAIPIALRQVYCMQDN